MPMNHIQSQPGMSMREFLCCFGTEVRCAQAVKAARWSHDFACPRCGCTQHCMVCHEGRLLYQCNCCRRSR